MALQAPERRHRSLQEDLARAFALSQADKRLGEYFAPTTKSSTDWHFDGTEHTGGGFDSQEYAYKGRGQIRKEWEVSVVQWARERDSADGAWAAEQAARNERWKTKTVWAPEEVDIQDAKRNVERAWIREQQQLEGLTSESSKHNRRISSPPVLPTPVDARRLNEQFIRPSLGEISSADRTKAWLGNRGETAGIQDFRMDPSEQGELHTMSLYHEDVKQGKPRRQPSSRPHGSDSGPSRRHSMVSSSKPPSLPSKVLSDDDKIHSSPRSMSRSLSVASKTSDGTVRRIITQRTPIASPPTSLRVGSGPVEEISSPPSLPTKPSHNNSSSSLHTESRHSRRSGVDPSPEVIQVYSPNSDVSNHSVHIRSRPVSARSQKRDSMIEKVPTDKERPLSYPIMVSDSQHDLEFKDGDTEKLDSVIHIRNSGSTWSNLLPPGLRSQDMLFNEVAMEGIPVTSDPSFSTLVPDLTTSPRTSLHFAQAVRRLTEAAAADPMNPRYLSDMPFTVPSAFRSHSQISVANLAPDLDDEGTQRGSAPPTPLASASMIPPTAQERASTSQVNVDKSLPGTPYTMTHSVVSSPRFDPDALEADTTDYSSLPRRSIDTNTSRVIGPVHDDSPGSTQERAGSTGSRSTGILGDAEGDPNVATRPERKRSKRSSGRKKRHGGSETSSHHSSEGSGSTIKASARTRSQGSREESESDFGVVEGGEGPGLSRSGGIRRTATLPPGSSHTRISYSDSESGNEDTPTQTHESHDYETLPPRYSFTNGHYDEEVDPEDDAQYAEVPEFLERHPPGRMSSNTFGRPEPHTGTNMTFRDSRDWRGVNEKNESRTTLSSRPQSMAPSVRSNRTRTSTLRASLRSPLPGISERDTASELSWGGDERNASGSLLDTVPNESGGQEDEVIHVEAREIIVEPIERGPDLDQEYWGEQAWDAAAARKSTSSKPKSVLRRTSQTIAADGQPPAGEPDSHSSSEFGEELKEGFVINHPPGSYHGSRPNSIAKPQSTGAGTGSGEQNSQGVKADEWVEWHEDSESGMAGVGAHGKRAKVSYNPYSSDEF